MNARGYEDVLTLFEFFFMDVCYLHGSIWI